MGPASSVREREVTRTAAGPDVVALRRISETDLNRIRSLRLAALLVALPFAWFGSLASLDLLGRFALLVVYYGGIGAVALAALALAVATRQLIRRPLGWSLALAISGLITVGALPAAVVTIRGQWPNPSWYVLYLTFLPTSTLVGAHLGMLGLSVRRASWPLVAPSALGLAGAIFSVFIMDSLFFDESGWVILAFVLAIGGLASAGSIYAWGGRVVRVNATTS